jgi:hypothetical protein
MPVGAVQPGRGGGGGGRAVAKDEQRGGERKRRGTSKGEESARYIETLVDSLDGTSVEDEEGEEGLPKHVTGCQTAVEWRRKKSKMFLPFRWMGGKRPLMA